MPIVLSKYTNQPFRLLTTLYLARRRVERGLRATMPPPPQTPQHAQQHGHGSAGAGNNNAFLHTVLNTNPNSSSPSRHAGQRGVGVTSAPTQFSATQRSAQARGMEYNKVGRAEESYESRLRREEAGRILESVEMLIWWSSARNEVIITLSYVHISPFALVSLPLQGG